MRLVRLSDFLVFFLLNPVPARHNRLRSRYAYFFRLILIFDFIFLNLRPLISTVMSPLFS